MRRSRFSDEHLFASYAHARQVINDWRNDYNNHRPHTSLEGLTPNEFATRSRMDHNVNRTNL
jgi:putative transposase